MAINKIVLNTENGEQVLVDLTGDSVTPETLAEGYTAHDAAGNLITGTMVADGGEDLDAVIAEQSVLIEELSTALDGKAAGGNGGTSTPKLQEKSVTPTTLAQSVVPDSGYDGLSKVNVGAIPSDYIVPSGTKSITENGTHDVTAYASVSVNVPTSGGGTGIEMCSVKFTFGNGTGRGFVIYSTGSTVERFDINGYTWESFSVPKHSIVVYESNDTLSNLSITVTSSIQRIDNYGVKVAAFAVYGNGTIDLSLK